MVRSNDIEDTSYEFSFCLVQMRRLENIDFDRGVPRKYFIKTPSYSDLLKFLQTRKTNTYKNDDDDNSNQNIDDAIAPEKEQISSADRRFFLFNSKRPSHNKRPANAYGRKSHWDTFFG
jgi:hypothetical protein